MTKHNARFITETYRYRYSPDFLSSTMQIYRVEKRVEVSGTKTTWEGVLQRYPDVGDSVKLDGFEFSHRIESRTFDEDGGCTYLVSGGPRDIVEDEHSAMSKKFAEKMLAELEVRHKEREEKRKALEEELEAIYNPKRYGYADQPKRSWFEKIFG